jgi:hypothetical protein
MFLFGRSMAQVESCQPHTAGARVRARVSPCGIYSARSPTATGSFPLVLQFSLSTSFHSCSACSYNICGWQICQSVAAVQRHSFTHRLEHQHFSRRWVFWDTVPCSLAGVDWRFRRRTASIIRDIFNSSSISSFLFMSYFVLYKNWFQLITTV